MSYAAGVILGILACVVVLMALLQVHEYLRGRSLLTRRHLILRLTVAGLMLLAVGCIYVGVVIPFPGVWHELAYWCVLFILLITVTILALVDLRMLERVKHERRAELFRQLAEIEDTLRRVQREAEESVPRPTEDTE